jgi:ABC-type amino acid transport substrate-binding protein
MIRLVATIVLLTCVGMGATSVEASRSLRHPAAESLNDPRGAYPLLVLRTALEKAGTDVSLRPYPVRASQERVMRLIESGALDVGWSMATADREARLGMVPFPVDRGLLGWRRLLTKQQALPRFAGVRDVSDLEGLRVAQGHDWPDLTILEANGLPTIRAVGYDSLFALLDRGRVDYLARAASEAERERVERASIDLAIAPDLVLHYRTALVFYVQKEDIVLRDQLSRGLQAMLADGSLDRLFVEAYGPDIAMLAAPGLQRIALHNPIAATGLETAPSSAWWSP